MTVLELAARLNLDFDDAGIKESASRNILISRILLNAVEYANDYMKENVRNAMDAMKDTRRKR